MKSEVLCDDMLWWLVNTDIVGNILPLCDDMLWLL